MKDGWTGWLEINLIKLNQQIKLSEIEFKTFWIKLNWIDLMKFDWLIKPDQPATNVITDSIPAICFLWLDWKNWLTSVNSVNLQQSRNQIEPELESLGASFRRHLSRHQSILSGSSNFSVPAIMHRDASYSSFTVLVRYWLILYVLAYCYNNIAGCWFPGLNYWI